MTWEITEEASFRESVDIRKIAEDVMRRTLEVLECPYEGMAELMLTDAASMQEINRETRGIDKVTDVLSFPANEFPAPGDFSEVDAFYPDNDELYMGDVVICVERCEAQAEEYGHALKREYAFLITHSLLHLCGFDHMTPEDAEEMEALQNRILSDLGITRDCK